MNSADRATALLERSNRQFREEANHNDAIQDVVRVDALLCFEQLVRELGGDPHELLTHVAINPDVIGASDGIISYRSLVHLLHNCSIELDCPHFGLELAARQGGLPVLGPLEFAMMNSETFGQAYEYCTQHLQSYSPAVQLMLGPRRKNALRFIRFDIVLSRLLSQEQAIEHAMALMCHAIRNLSENEIGLREVWFAHEAVSPPAVYRNFLNTHVFFGKPFNAVFMNSEDFDRPLKNRDPRLYALATNFIDTQYPDVDRLLSSQVRMIGTRLLAEGKCTQLELSKRLAMHPRTLQRRLRSEGVSFEELKDELRKEVALRYLAQRSLTLTRIAGMLGYAEPSVLTRSCHRWFGRSPREIRRELQALSDE